MSSMQLLQALVSETGKSLAFQLPEEILDLINDANLVKYFQVASVSLLAYDYALMLPEEIQYIWTTRWTSNWGSIVYLLTRYLAFVDASILTAFLFDSQIPALHCSSIYKVAAWFELAGIFVAEVVLLMRTCAIWEQSRRILFICCTMLTAMIIPGAVVLQLDFKTLEFFPSPFPTIAPCISSGGKSILYIDYALVLGFESVIIALTAWVGIRQRRNEVNPLTTVLYRDAAIFSSILFLTSTANVIVLAGTSSIALHLLLLEPQRVLHSVLTSRILLHLRAASAVGQPTSSPVQEKRIEFALPGSYSESTHDELVMDGGENLSSSSNSNPV